MRDVWDEHEDLLEQLVKWLTVFTFVLLCWTFHRAIRPRATCVSSSFVRTVIVEGQRVNNCAFESRLQLGGPNLTQKAAARLRRLEMTPAFDQWFAREPKLLVEIDEAKPRAFDLYRGSVRLGTDWIDDGPQLKRALAMAMLKAQPSFAAATNFQIETLADFILITIDARDPYLSNEGRRYTFERDVKFTTAPATLGEYCRSPFRSLAHEELCAPNTSKAAQKQSTLWGFRPLLAAALARTFHRLPLAQKIAVVKRLRAGVTLPNLETPRGPAVDKLVDWFGKTLTAHAVALGLGRAGDDVPVKRTLRDLEVEAPTRWELTIDLRYTPAWRAIVGQLIDRAKFRPLERTLLFTPAGEVALPSGLSVAWGPGDVESQKHVMIACQFPPVRAGAMVKSQQFFARQTCGTLNGSFWD